MQQPRIWLVEDEQSIADTLVYMLQQEGFQVSVFGRGLPALEAAAHQAPDVAILDVGLAGISRVGVWRCLLAAYLH
ncbi:response regulator, partial [Klebsiella pneumoniae]|uniref:response regulator n=1 Tax=Klebsiella pneumoniae TaxID=573 RepID=UPI00396B4E16